MTDDRSLDEDLTSDDQAAVDAAPEPAPDSPDYDDDATVDLTAEQEPDDDDPDNAAAPDDEEADDE